MKVDLANLMSHWQSKSEKKAKGLFKLAKRKANDGRVVIYVDEADSIMSDRKENESSSTAGVKAVFLSELADLIAGRGQNYHNIFIIFCSNHPGRFDKALQQRIERKIYIGLPRHQEKFEKMKIVAAENGIKLNFTEEDLRNRVDLKYMSICEIVTLTRKSIDIGSHTRSQRSNHFHEIKENGSSVRYKGCNQRNCSDPDKSDKLLPEVCKQIEHSELTIEDIQKARKCVLPTTTEKDLEQFQKYFGLSQFGEIRGRLKTQTKGKKLKAFRMLEGLLGPII